MHRQSIHIYVCVLIGYVSRVNTMWNRHMTAFKDQIASSLRWWACVLTQMLPRYCCLGNNSTPIWICHLGLGNRSTYLIFRAQVAGCLWSSLTEQFYRYNCRLSLRVGCRGMHHKHLVKNDYVHEISYNSRWPGLFIKFINALMGLPHRNILLLI